LFSLLSGRFTQAHRHFSAAFDVLANFLRLSFLAFRVNIFFLLSSFAQPRIAGKVCCFRRVEVSMRQLRYAQNFKIPLDAINVAKPRLLCYSLAVAWVWVRPAIGSDIANKRLDCASTSLTRLLCGSGRSIWYLLRVSNISLSRKSYFLSSCRLSSFARLSRGR